MYSKSQIDYPVTIQYIKNEIKIRIYLENTLDIF
jgi:hypothetical protein